MYVDTIPMREEWYSYSDFLVWVLIAREENSRTFIDEDFADACKAGDLLAFIESPFVFPPSVLAEMESAIGSLGIKIASRKVEEQRFN